MSSCSNSNEYLLLFIRSVAGSAEVVAALLDGGASVNATAGAAMSGAKALYLAAQYGHAHICRLLLQRGAWAT